VKMGSRWTLDPEFQDHTLMRQPNLSY